MSGFSRSEKVQLLAAVRSGDLHKVKSVINSSASPFIPDPETFSRLQYLRNKVVDDSELFLKGYTVISINKRGHHQERFLLLTAQAIYHVKFDFSLNQVHHVKRFPLTTVSHVYWGHLCDEYSNPSRSTNVKRSAIQYGVQIHFKSDNPDGLITSTGKMSSVRTYIPLVPPSATDGSSKAIAEEITIPIEVSLVSISVSTGEVLLPSGIIVQHEITRPSGGVVSLFYNGLKLGFWRRKRGVDEMGEE
ncbi:hypothetical protein P9112_007562 [Eukaryota sp. TZLM1-RC]